MPREFDDEEWNEESEQSPIKKRASHIRCCCAEGCTSKGYRLLIAGERVQYFPFPLFDKVLCQRWAAAVKLQPGFSYEKSFVCSKHFRSSDYKARSHEDSKKSLRRTAIPSLLPVVQQGKGRKMLVEDTSDETEEDESNDKLITTLVSKEDRNGQSFTLLVVNDEGDDARDDLDDTVPKVLQTKKVPLRCEDLLGLGPPFPWRHEGLTSWVGGRLASHQEQVDKNRISVAEQEEAVRVLEEKIQEAISVTAHLALKLSMGRVNVTQRIKQLAE